MEKKQQHIHESNEAMARHMGVNVQPTKPVTVKHTNPQNGGNFSFNMSIQGTGPQHKEHKPMVRIPSGFEQMVMGLPQGKQKQKGNSFIGKI